MAKDKTVAETMIRKHLLGEETYTNEGISNVSGFSMASINNFRAKIKAELLAEGHEIVVSKRGRKPGSTEAPNSPIKAPRQPKAPQTPVVDIEALKAQLRSEIEAEYAATKIVTSTEILNELELLEKEATELRDRRAVLNKQYQERLQAEQERSRRLLGSSTWKQIVKPVGAVAPENQVAPEDTDSEDPEMQEAIEAELNKRRREHASSSKRAKVG